MSVHEPPIGYRLNLAINPRGALADPRAHVWSWERMDGTAKSALFAKRLEAVTDAWTNFNKRPVHFKGCS